MSDHFDRTAAEARVRDFFAGPRDADSLVRFHATEKLAVMAHSPALARELGRLVAFQRENEPAELARRYRHLHCRAERHLRAGGSDWARSQPLLREAS